MQKKLDASSYDTDKSEHMLEIYGELLAGFVGQDIRVLELGVRRGGSLLLWRDYLKTATVVGVDSTAIEIDDSTGKIFFYQGEQQDTSLLDRIGKERAPGGFDVIIDDCSHIGELTRISFWHLFDNHLKPGGLYIIEDWGTGYFNDWIDGRQYKLRKKPVLHRIRSLLAAPFEFLLKNRGGRFARLYKVAYYKQRFLSHDYGMVGFIKQLVDECGMRNITLRGRSVLPRRCSKFRKIQISDGQVVVFKSL